VSLGRKENMEEIMSFNFTIGPNELWICAMAAASFVAWFIGRKQGYKAGVDYGALSRTLQIDHVFMHALDAETKQKIKDGLRIYMADPVNVAHINNDSQEGH
jgi:hypothetical protein